MPPQQPQYQQPPYPASSPGIPASQAGKQRSWGLIAGLTVAILLFLAAAGFGAWAYMERTDYKDNSDKKAAAAAEVAKEQEASRKDAEFVEKEKNPLKKYQGPSTFGSLDVSYPKTWSAFVTESDRGPTPIDGYFHPNFVPGLQSGTAFALRVQVTSQPYEQEMKQFDAKVKTGKVKVSAFAAKNVPSARGSRVDGEINTGQQDSMILIPLRDRTLKIWTESQQFLGDFNNIILENLKFVP